MNNTTGRGQQNLDLHSLALLRVSVTKPATCTSFDQGLKAVSIFSRVAVIKVSQYAQKKTRRRVEHRLVVALSRFSHGVESRAPVGIAARLLQCDCD